AGAHQNHRQKDDRLCGCIHLLPFQKSCVWICVIGSMCWVHPCADRRQTWRFGSNSARWCTVPTRILNCFVFVASAEWIGVPHSAQNACVRCRPLSAVFM